MAIAKGPKDLICSARQCESPAAWAIIWSNPNIHFGRSKTWLSCEGHRDFLEDYLGQRDFPTEVITVEDLPNHPSQQQA